MPMMCLSKEQVESFLKVRAQTVPDTYYFNQVYSLETIIIELGFLCRGHTDFEAQYGATFERFYFKTTAAIISRSQALSRLRLLRAYADIVFKKVQPIKCSQWEHNGVEEFLDQLDAVEGALRLLTEGDRISV